MDQVFSFKKTKRLKITGIWGKILEKSGNFVSPEKWEPCGWRPPQSRHLVVATAPVGTHPTGLHSCLYMFPCL